MDRLLTFFGVERLHDSVPGDVFPTGLAPFIRKAVEGSGNRVVEDGAFGLLPVFAKELAYGRRTYNARTETVAKLPSFREAWKKGLRCVIPAEAIYEPSYESGRAVRWRISQPSDIPMGIAGIYLPWTTPEGKEMFSFAMLTVNADGHPVMQRFHKPEDEKRMVVILDPAEYDEWLGCSVADAPKFFKQWTGPLDTEAAPLARSPKLVKPPPEAPPQGDLF